MADIADSTIVTLKAGDTGPGRRTEGYPGAARPFRGLKRVKPMVRGSMLVLAAVFMTAGLMAARADAGTLSFDIVLKSKKPQMAIWLEDKTGRYVQTLFVTRKTGQKGLGNRNGELDDRFGGPRLSMLPVWAHHRGVDYGGGNCYPPKSEPLPDAVTGASPGPGEFVWTAAADLTPKPGTYRFFVEINESFDKNASHDYSWYRGQPSVVWAGEITIGDSPAEGQAVPVGHGHPDGADGGIQEDLSSLTTAKDLIRTAICHYRP